MFIKRPSSTTLNFIQVNLSLTSFLFRRRIIAVHNSTLTAMTTATPRHYSMSEAEAVLRSRFNHTSFRSGQRRTIELLIASTPPPGIPDNQVGRALAVFPTGSGKSLCYQLPALLYDDGLTLVVSPLMALMKDQVDSLVRKDIPAACLDSSVNASETRELYDRISSREIRILFVSPERFNNTRFIKAIRRVPLALMAIDEAHCISEWGHSFRPDYLRLSRWVNRLQVQRRLALTATATPQVAKDICQAMEIPFPAGQVRTPSVRPNLTTRVTLVSPLVGGTNSQLRDALTPRVDLLSTRLAERPPGPTIVYVTLQATAKVVAEMLRERGFDQALSYHAGMKQDDRKATQDSFMANNKNALVIATIAFGMGMDHSSIRYVYHLNTPKTLEGYIQEIGRAGRDGQPSICESLVSVDDIPTLEGFIFGETPNRTSVRSVLEKLFSGRINVGDEIMYSLFDLSYECDIRGTCLGQIIAQLDLSEHVMEETTPVWTIIDCKLPVDSRRMPPVGSIGHTVITAAGGYKRTQVSVDTLMVAENTGMEYGKISRICDDLCNEGYFRELKSRKIMHRAKVNRVPTDLDAMADRLHAALVKSRDRQLERLREVVNFYSAEECQTKFLARHLGDELNLEGPCEHCEFCLSGQAVPFKDVVNQREERKLDQVRWSKVCNENIPRTDPLLLARIAAGITSPIISRKFRKLASYGSMDDHDFNVLLRAAEKECGVKS